MSPMAENQITHTSTVCWKRTARTPRAPTAHTLNRSTPAETAEHNGRITPSKRARSAQAQLCKHTTERPCTKTVGDVDVRMMHGQVHGGHRAGPCNIGRVRSDGQATCAQWCAQQASVSRVPSARQLNTSARKAGLESQDVRRITMTFAGKTCNAGRS